MKHATKAALWVARNRIGEWLPHGDVPALVAACSGAPLKLDDLMFSARDARCALGLMPGVPDMPDCPKCRVLLDQALDSPDAKPLDFTVSP